MKVGKRSNFQNIYDNRSKQSIDYALNQIKNSRILPYINKIYLYGSCARKEQKYNSDVDLFIVLSTNFDTTKYRNDVIVLKSVVTPADMSLPEVDLKIVVGDSWEHDKMLYYQNIKKEGIKIWPIH